MIRLPRLQTFLSNRNIKRDESYTDIAFFGAKTFYYFVSIITSGSKHEKTLLYFMFNAFILYVVSLPSLMAIHTSFCCVLSTHLVVAVMVRTIPCLLGILLSALPGAHHCQK